MKISLLSLIIVTGMTVYRVETAAHAQRMDHGPWTSEFLVERGELSAAGHNPFFILEPGHQSVFEGGKERLTITVLDETKSVDGVETRVVEERETKDGKLVEVSRNYFAISKRTTCSGTWPRR
jgi:hypothetical protein